MSYLPIVLIVIFLLSRKNPSILDGFDFESVSPLLSLFGVSEEVLSLLKGDEIKNLASGNFDLKSILPLVTSLFSHIKSEPSTPVESPPNFSDTPEYLNPIKDVASADIISSLGSYFS